MKKEKRIYMTLLFPGLFFPEHVVKQVKSADVPKTVPSDCYGFEFNETEYIVDGNSEYEGESKRIGKTYIIGEPIHVNDIPDTDRGQSTSILKDNIRFNSPTKTAIKTHLGNWQMETKDHVAISPSKFKFSKPTFYKNHKK